MLAAEKESLKNQRTLPRLGARSRRPEKETAELEEAMARLCESPFINTSYKNEKEVMELRKHRKDAKSQLMQIEFLQDAVKVGKPRCRNAAQLADLEKRKGSAGERKGRLRASVGRV